MRSQTTVRVPTDSLPDDALRRSKVLDEYFRDLLPTAKCVQGGWDILLERPSDSRIYIDPNLPIGLDWWGGLEISEIFSAYEQRRGFFLSLHDCWSLLSWSNWMQQWVWQNGSIPSKVTVLHADDHTDLMNPLLLRTNNRLEDMLTSQVVQLDAPQSVEQALYSGAIGIGSFIAPFLHSFESVTFLHLVQRNAKHTSDISSSLYATHTADNLLFLEGQRPAIVIGESVPDGCNTRRLGCYARGTSLVNLLEYHDDGPILLHIDMDVFNNRFDGDSDWPQNCDRHDPSTNVVVASIGQLFDCLATSSCSKDVQDITVALSPGFFPAELWKICVDTVEQCLNAVSSKFSISFCTNE